MKRTLLGLAVATALCGTLTMAQTGDGPDWSIYDNFDPTLYDIENGKEVYETGGVCLQCHGWDGAGLGRNPRAPGPAPNLRETPLDPYLLHEVIACGRPDRPMPHHDAQAYVDDRCYGLLAADFEPGEMPERGRTLDPDEMADLVAYLVTNVVGAGETTLADCEAFYRPGHRNCRGLTN